MYKYVPFILTNIAYTVEQQVINLLRERLEMATGELVEQKERVDVLETKLALNTEKFHGLVENVHQRGEY